MLPPLDFQTDTTSSSRLMYFAETMLWPHIENMERLGLHFVRYAVSHHSRCVRWLTESPKMGNGLRDNRDAWLRKRYRSSENTPMSEIVNESVAPTPAITTNSTSTIATTATTGIPVNIE